MVNTATRQIFPEI